MISKLKALYRDLESKSETFRQLARRWECRTLFNRTRSKIRGKKNLIIRNNAILSGVTFDIKGYDNYIEIGRGCFLKDVTFSIRGNNHRITIGERCDFNRGGSIWFEDIGCSLSIGSDSTFENPSFAITESGSKITIGHDCMMAYNIDIRTGDSHSVLTADGSKRLNYSQDVTIGDHVWIAAHTVILKGVNIPSNSVVATGAIVTKPFETEGIIIGGNPAKQIKTDITWSRQRVYLESS